MGATCGIYAQQQTVVDSRGKAVNVMIPDASEMMAGYVDVDYVDDKFYNSGIQQVREYTLYECNRARKRYGSHRS